MTEREKKQFYEIAAKRFKAEVRLYGATAAVHIENKNDVPFWEKVLLHAYPKGKFRFITSSRSATGNVTCGCTQCMQYHPFLDNRFWIAIDSDYRYLGEEPGIDTDHFVLQTYTYSFENHICYGPNMNRAYHLALGFEPDAILPEEIAFDFDAFLKEYSFIVYPLMVWQLYLSNINKDEFPQAVFHRLLHLSIPKEFWKDNGASVLDILRKRSRKLQMHLKNKYPDADYTWYEARCNELGLTRDNCYLFVRGHNLYDSLIPLASNLVSHHKSMNKMLKGNKFENILTSHICFDQYHEINAIINDINTILKK